METLHLQSLAGPSAMRDQLVGSFHVALAQRLVQRGRAISIQGAQGSSVVAKQRYHIHLTPQPCKMDGHPPSLHRPTAFSGRMHSGTDPVWCPSQLQGLKFLTAQAEMGTILTIVGHVFLGTDFSVHTLSASGCSAGKSSPYLWHKCLRHERGALSRQLPFLPSC